MSSPPRRLQPALRFAAQRPETALWLGLAAAFLLGTLVYTALAWSPSSYAVALELFGAPEGQRGLVFGTPRPNRSDEWAVLTPFFQIAAMNDLGPVNEFSPYRESLNSFFALPQGDYSMLFRPQMWGFLVLPPAYAYSFYWCVLIGVFVFGYALLMRRFRLPVWIGLAAALLLFFSRFTQVWWTTTGSVLAFAPWLFVAMLTPARPWVRGLLVFYAGAAWLFATVYPPYEIGAAFALGAATLALRPDVLRRPGVLIPTVVGGLAALSVAGLYYWDVIEAMRHTSHPGVRNFGGGGQSPLLLLSSLFPYVHAHQYQPLPGVGPNPVEIGTIGSYLPLMVLVFADHGRLVQAVRARPWASAMLFGALAMVVAWMLLPLPPWLGLPLLWNQVPTYRFPWPLGVLVTIIAAWLAALAPFQLTARRMLVFLGLAAFAWLGVKRGDPLADWFDAVVLGAVLAAAAIGARRPDWWKPAAVCAALATSVFTFGGYNPVQSTRPIFAPPETPVIAEYRAMAQSHPRGWSVHLSGIGAIWAGLGLPSVTHTMLRPQMDFFRPLFPDLPEEEFDRLFNRYEHVVLSMEEEPGLVASNQVRLPYRRFAAEIPLQRPDSPAPPGPDTGETSGWRIATAPEGRWRIAATGWLPLDIPAGSSLAQAAADVRFALHGFDTEGLTLDQAWAAQYPQPQYRDSVEGPYIPYVIILAGEGDGNLALERLRAAVVSAGGAAPRRLPLTARVLSAALDDDLAAALAAPAGGAMDRIVYDPAQRRLSAHGWIPGAAGEVDSLTAVTDIPADAVSVVSAARPDVLRLGLADTLYSGFRIDVEGVDAGEVTPEASLCILAVTDGTALRIHDGRAPECRLAGHLEPAPQ